MRFDETIRKIEFDEEPIPALCNEGFAAGEQALLGLQQSRNVTMLADEAKRHAVAVQGQPAGEVSSRR